MMCFKSNDTKSPISGPRSGTSVQVRKHRATAPAVAIGYLEPAQPQRQLWLSKGWAGLSPVQKVLRSNQGSRINRPRSAQGLQGAKTKPDKTLIDIRTCPYTMPQLIGYIAGYQRIMPEYEVFMDGELYAVVARHRRPSNNQR